MKKHANPEKPVLYVSIALLAASMVLLFLLNTKITVYSDDYWYGTFFDHGLRGFLSEMLSHYRYTNGRLYVHILVPIVLLFDTKLFAVISPILLALLAWFGAKYLNEKLSLAWLFLSSALGVFGVLACDVEYLRMTLLWVSAYFNYIFPVAAAVLAGWFLERLRGDHIQSNVFFAAGVMFCFLAGASTEQGGIMTLILLWGGALLHRITEGKHKSLWVYPVSALAGFLTILLAPGSWERVGRGIDGGFFSFLNPSVFWARFLNVFEYMEHPSTVVILTAVFLLAALLALGDPGLNRGLLLGFPLAVGQAAAFLFGWAEFGCCWMVLGCLLLAVLFCLDRTFRPTGLLLLASLAANGMLIITTLNYERTAFPSIMALLLVLISLLVRLLERLPLPAAGAVTAAVVILCIAAWVPTFRGYCASKEVVDKNLAAVEESWNTGVCYIDIDIDPRYRFTMLFEGGYFYTNFRLYYGMDENTKIVFTSRNWELHELASETETYIFPTLTDERGLFFPIEFTLAAAGGSAVYDWRDSTFTIQFRDKTYLLTGEGVLSRLEPDGNWQVLTEDFLLLMPYSHTYTLLYCPAEQLAGYFGLEWAYDGDQYVIPPQS